MRKNTGDVYLLFNDNAKAIAEITTAARASNVNSDTLPVWVIVTVVVNGWGLVVVHVMTNFTNSPGLALTDVGVTEQIIPGGEARIAASKDTLA
ncbi:hypothetical protein [Pyrobaculum aerophilum]|uniref:Uncharacterized protein n=1 Tax=Pyrobaculum aerophilum TaxID=13773 RepID=A0A832SQR1_9CREN|nr:hypothetical protein [Pyrobaculum aerophilum]HII46410.1 hypothetical protein [Pyrobaculum aerophilum]